MSLYRVDGDSLEPVTNKTFAALQIREREALQRLLRSDLVIFDEGLGDDRLEPQGVGAGDDGFEGVAPFAHLTIHLAPRRLPPT
ncbi:hypothetical protein HQQ81_13205 [Microbacteriaceae bacterium VKM Ac-2854]|nr:hypothetical protein [Microbacteriaceae bacterium VKM Ac-2854]